MKKTQFITKKVGTKTIWNHPGGKFRRLGPNSCTEEELLAILIESGNRSRSAELISKELIEKYKNLNGLMGISLKEFMQIKGIKEVKATQIATVFEMAKRIVKRIEAT